MKRQTHGFGRGDPVLDAQLMVVAAGHYHGPRGRAHRTGESSSEFHPLAGCGSSGDEVEETGGKGPRIWATRPPRIQVWVRDKLVSDYQDVLVDGKPRFSRSGSIGSLVHPGKSWGKPSKVAFRKIMLKELK